LYFPAHFSPQPPYLNSFQNERISSSQQLLRPNYQ
jgi:hypothetical protein